MPLSLTDSEDGVRPAVGMKGSFYLVLNGSALVVWLQAGIKGFNKFQVLERREYVGA